MYLAFEEGDRVILPTDYYGCAENNPVWGTEHGCGGEVTESYEDEVIVEWDNGRVNSYQPKHLDFESSVHRIKENNPNRTFIRVRAEDRRREIREEVKKRAWKAVKSKGE